ncbi:OLC1v1024047C1 [Oldenlandia corymbosa var. corymbosa]|uniref:OLC1v1024047C1 n=1 Tax=Oldenlandia corymbosa var. corymbosa TaxID=529605 RepID=A0AAV1C257_OLDCO|nr:OLC1v1024047C1 [Oldenlandia corymbosa var. corymbosa]
MASPTLITPTTSTPKPLSPIKSKPTTNPATTSTAAASAASATVPRRNFLKLAAAAAAIISPALLLPVTPAALAAEEAEYVKETSDVINKVRSTINLDRNDPNVATAVAELRETSNFWVAKYRKEKSLLGRPSFRDMYSALNAVSGHYISFGPTAPIPAKRKQRILEEVDTAEKALARGR